MDKVFSPFGKGEKRMLSRKWYTKKNYHIDSAEEIEAWFNNDSLFLIRISEPHIAANLKSFLTYLGKPEKKIQPYTNSIAPMATQWIFAKKGITLYVDEFLKDKGKAFPEKYIERIVLYRPTTTEYYIDNFGAYESKVYLPR